jgi:hypothetical protein
VVVSRLGFNSLLHPRRYVMIEIEYSNGSIHTCETTPEAEDTVLKIFNDSGMLPEYITAPDEGVTYACTWDVTIDEI